MTTVRTEQRITQMGGGTRISPAMETKQFIYTNRAGRNLFEVRTEIDIVVNGVDCRRYDELDRGLEMSSVQ